MIIAFYKFKEGLIYQAISDASRTPEYIARFQQQNPLFTPLYYLELNEQGVVRKVMLPERKIGWYAIEGGCTTQLRYWDGTGWLVHKKATTSTGENWDGFNIVYIPQLS